jgi:esterase/lipase
VTDEPIAFGTDDGVTIKGHLYSTPGPKRRVVVFAHEYPKDQKAWQGFAREITSPGVSAVTFDFRGYGETGGSKDVSKIDHDLEAAVRFLKSRDYPLMYVVGASMGGTATLKVAARNELAGAVLVSAPTNFMGLDARQDVSKVTEPKLFIASRGDDDAPAAVATFMQSSPEPKQSQLFDGSAHGSELLQGNNTAAFKRLVIDFVSR